MSQKISRRVVDGLELLSASPQNAVPGAASRSPLLFVHGSFSGAWVWAERFLALFSAAGYECHALSLRGHGGSRGGEWINSHSIRDYVDDVERIVGEIERAGQPPILLGHSMGGFVVQKYLEHHTARAAVLMCSVPPQGLMAATFHMMFQRPELLLEINCLMGQQQIDSRAAREALFAKPIPEAEVASYMARMSMESQRAIWDMTMFNLVSIARVKRTPLFVLGTECDALIPPFLVTTTAHAYSVHAHIFDGFGHGFMLEPDSETIAAAVIGWLDARH
jgi:pimeloyl-ACP methyl ester carboxylesterase